MRAWISHGHQLENMSPKFNKKSKIFAIILLQSDGQVLCHYRVIRCVNNINMTTDMWILNNEIHVCHYRVLLNILRII